MTDQQKLQFCAEVFRQRIRQSPASDDVKDTLQMMLDIMPDFPTFSREQCLEWVNGAARTVGCSDDERRALRQVTAEIFVKPQ